jgi:Protein of unknown function (DUF1391)
MDAWKGLSARMVSGLIVPVKIIKARSETFARSFWSVNNMNKTEDMGNNETRSYGIFKESQGWLAMSRTQSKWFKTEKGAINWLKRNYPNLAQKIGI